MILNYNIISLIDFLALTQGLLLGLILIRKKKSLLLGLFLITFSIEVLNALLSDLGFLKQYPILLFLPVRFYFLSAPLLYLYAKSLTTSISLSKHWKLFIAGILEFFIFIYLFLLPSAIKENISDTYQYYFNELYFNVGLIYASYFVILTIKLLIQHQKNVLEYFSNTENKMLKWIQKVAIYLLTFCVLWLVLYIVKVETTTFWYTVMSTINLIFIYWVGISGLNQSRVRMRFSNVESDNNFTKNNTALEEKTIEESVYHQLLQLMSEREIFKNSKLTLSSVANELNISARKVSEIINQFSNKNFNRFINEYRVEEAKKILVNPKFDYLNMLGIADEVGFSSKATFFAVFKQFEGISPGVYKKQTLHTLKNSLKSRKDV